jgi:sugar phosphate isomerase/epimerase
MRFGICVSPSSFPPRSGESPAAALRRMLETLRAAGAEYVEFPVAAVAAEGNTADFEQLQSALDGAALRAEAFNVFVPKHHPITGPAVNLAPALKYCATALRRCKALGGEVVVLGSAGARKVPDGFDRAKGEAQFIEFCRELGPVADEAGIDIAIEPLNRKEDNLILSVEHGAKVVEAVAHQRIRLLADLYHISEEKEPVENVARAGKHLIHTHVADLGRVAPGFAHNGEEDFIGFFRALKRAGYDRRCSFEGKFENIEQQTKPLLELLRKRWSEAA